MNNITSIPPQMRTGRSWYEGTADAVYQNLYLIERSGADLVVILSGDHVYRMDYSAMLRAHGETRADVTVASMRVALGEAGRFGILSIDEANRITRFEEKPVRPKPMPGDREHALASMGIYVFSREFLSEVLREDHEIEGSSHDFGNDILPRLISSCRVYAYLFGGHTGRVAIDRYWRDVGDLDAYHAANMDLLEPVPAMNIYQVDWPIRTFQIPSPPARSVVGRSGVSAQLINSMVSSGSIVAGACIRHSILSPNVRVNDGAVVENAILFEGVRVGEGARLCNCIVEKQVKVPPGVSIGLGSPVGLRAVHRFPGRDRCRSRKLPVHPVAHIQPLTGSPINLPSFMIVVIQNRRAEDRPKTTIKTKSYQVAHAAPGGHGPPSDGKAQGRWSAASRRGTKSAGHSLLMPRPEVTAHPATAKCKAGGPRRPDAEQSRQVTRCSCRTRRSRPTQRLQCARQVVRGVPTRNLYPINLLSCIIVVIQNRGAGDRLEITINTHDGCARTRSISCRVP